MQQLRRDDCDGVDVGALQELPIVGDQIEGMLPSARSGQVVVDVAAGHDRATRAFLEAGDDLSAPPAELDNADPDHWSCPAAVPRNGSMRTRLRQEVVWGLIHRARQGACTLE